MSLPERGPVPARTPDLESPPARELVRTLLVACAVALLGCATGAPAPEGAPDPEPDRGDRPPAEEAETEAPPSRLIGEARDLLDRGRADRAYLLADSLYFHYRAAGDDGAAARSLDLAATARLTVGDTAAAAELLGELVSDHAGGEDPGPAVRRLAALRVALGDDPDAGSVLLEQPDAWDDSARNLLREAAGHLSLAEFEELLGNAPADAPTAALSLLREERDRARGEAAEGGAVRIGLLLPSSGRLESVGGWLREGVSLALAAAPEGAPAVELVPVDLAGAGSIGGKVDRLIEAVVVAVIGPLRSDRVTAASAAAGQRLVVSPTANAAPSGPRPGYSLWDRDRRELDAAAALAGWLGAAVRPSGVGVLYPRTDMGRRSYLTFRRALGTAGGGVAAAVSFAPESTTVEEPIREIGAFAPPVVFAPASGAGSILQLAPQLSYYGIRGAVVAGGTDWSRPSTFRRLEPSFSQFRIAPTYLDRTEGGGWARFTERYEREYRRSLGENVLPALGYDAALLVLTALADTRPARPRAVARRFAELRRVAGATGPLTPDAETGTVSRTVEIRALADRELSATSAQEVRAWVEAASARTSPYERRRRARALRAVAGSGIELGGDARSSGGRR